MAEDTIRISGGPAHISYVRIGDPSGMVVIVLGDDREKTKRASVEAAGAIWLTLDGDHRPTSEKWKMPDGPTVEAERAR